MSKCTTNLRRALTQDQIIKIIELEHLTINGEVGQQSLLQSGVDLSKIPDCNQAKNTPLAVSFEDLCGQL